MNIDRANRQQSLPQLEEQIFFSSLKKRQNMLSFAVKSEIIVSPKNEPLIIKKDNTSLKQSNFKINSQTIKVQSISSSPENNREQTISSSPETSKTIQVIKHVQPHRKQRQSQISVGVYFANQRSLAIRNLRNQQQKPLYLRDQLPMINSQEFSQQQDTYEHQFRHLIFSPKVNEDIFKSHLIQIQKGLQYSKRHLKGPSRKLLKQMAVTIDSTLITKNKTLFLDLDETLVHSCSIFEQPDHIIDVGVAKIPIKIRPYCLEFLKQMSNYFDIFIFTASSDNYAQAILNFLDRETKYSQFLQFDWFIKGFYTREYCMETKNGLFIKDLRIFTNLTLQNLLLVDNLSHSFGLQIPNGIPILEWKSDKSDQELYYLGEYLKELSGSQDIQKYNSTKMRLNELLDYKIV